MLRAVSEVRGCRYVGTVGLGHDSDRANHGGVIRWRPGCRARLRRPRRSLAKATSLSAIQEEVINTESGSRTIGHLRTKIEADRERLASLDSASEAYRQARRQITRN